MTVAILVTFGSGTVLGFVSWPKLITEVFPYA